MTIAENQTIHPMSRGGVLHSLSALWRKVRTAGLAALAMTASAAGPALAQPAIWTIKDADSTIYLLGTVHLLKPDTAWTSEKLKTAIAAAQELWLELPTMDPERMAPEMMPLISKYGLSPQAPLSNDLTPEEMKTLGEAASYAGLTAAQLNVFRPWLAALTISTAAISRAGFDPASGVDRRIETMFKERGVTPNGLETIDQQLQIFANLSRAEEVAYLRMTISDYRKTADELEKMVAQWAKADLGAMEETLVAQMKTTSPDLYAELLTNRNARWAERIKTMLEGKGVSFIAVGAAHLIGEDSVLAMLKAKGVIAERWQ